MNSSLLAELAALGTSLCWSFSSIFITRATQRVNPLVANRLRILFGVLLVGLVHLLTYGAPWPVRVEPYRYGWLTLSSLVGLVVGDTFLFYAYRLIGARLGMLVFSLNPIFGALFGWFALREPMSALELVAMALALGGVAWVVLERPNGDAARPGGERHYTLGILTGLAAGACQAFGLILAKPALAGGFPSLSALAIRMASALVMIWLLAVLQGQAGPTAGVIVQRNPARWFILGGALAGPFIGVWLSLIAVQSERIGVVSTLMALTPVMLLPILHFGFKERISPRAVWGTLLAMAGTAMMILQ